VLALVLAGLIAFTMTLAKEGIKYNIKSNVIAPVSHLLTTAKIPAKLF